MNKLIFSILLIALITLTGCNNFMPSGPVRKVERYSGKLDQLISKSAEIEVLGKGYMWSEGPVWIESESMLLFSDVPANIMYKWTETEGVTEYLKPSGYTGIVENGSTEGSNGMTLDADGKLIICQHGDRRVSRLLSSYSDPKPEYKLLTNSYEGKSLNSPNDVVVHSGGAIYFTDPSYGLKMNVNDPAKELPYHGIFMLTPEGDTVLLTDEMSWPNGLAFSPDENILYVSNSDPKKAIWMAFDVMDDGKLTNSRILFDATELVETKPGLPDGLKIDDAGNLYATGPGGVLILTPEGEHIGTIVTGQPTANDAFNADKSVLYMTANNQLMRIHLK